MSSARRRLQIAGALLVGVVASGPFLLDASSGAAPALPTVSIAVTPSSASVTGALQSGAVDVVASDTGVKEAGLILLALKPGVSSTEAEAFLHSKKGARDINASSEIGSIVFDPEIDPGQKTEAATFLEPGQYLALIAPNEGPPRIAATFTVATSKAPLALPTPQATERSIEFGFRGPATLRDGQLVAFENEGWLVHMDAAFPVKSLGAANTVVRDLLSGREKGLRKFVAGPPVTFAGPMSHGAVMEETVAARPGIYVQVCFMETQDRRDHTRLGMERIIRILK